MEVCLKPHIFAPHDVNVIPYRWLFLIEGIITAAFGCIGPLIIVGYPREKYSWLSHDEQRYLVLRQRYSTNGQIVPRNEGNSPGLIKEVASRWHIYFQASCWFRLPRLAQSTYTYAPVPSDDHLLQSQCTRLQVCSHSIDK
jgi:hypothetical protein